LYIILRTYQLYSNSYDSKTQFRNEKRNEMTSKKDMRIIQEIKNQESMKEEWKEHKEVNGDLASGSYDETIKI
jgi:hypothetical protein